MMYYIYELARIFSCKFSLQFMYSLAEKIAILYHFLSVKDRQAVESNLKFIIPKDAAQKNNLHKLSRNMYINFGKYLVDFLRFEKVNIQFINKNIKIFGQDNLDEALKHGKGVIMLSCHIGNWELAGGMVGILGYPLNAIALSHKDNKVNNFFINQRKMLKMHTISIGISLKKCFRVLKENQLLAILADRDFSENGKEVMFFGRKALLPKGPAVFSLRTKAAIVPCFMIREPNNKFAFYMEKPIYPVSTNNPENDIGTLMNTYLKLIENYVRAYPDQWCVFRKIWN